MDEPRVRRIPARPFPTSNESWDEWVRPLLSRLGRAIEGLESLASKHSSRVVYWAGFASISGGLLWIVLLLLQQLETLQMMYGVYIDFYARASSYLYYLLGYQPLERLLAIPDLLFLIGITGVYTYQLRFTGRLLIRIGFLFAALGLTASIARAIFPVTSYFDHTGYIDPHGSFHLGNYMVEMFGRQWPAEWWSGVVFLNQMTVLAGLLLFYIAAIRTKSGLRAPTMSLVVTFLAMIVVPALVTWLFFDLYVTGERLFVLALSTLLLMLFGASWIWLGVLLLKKWQAKSDYMSWDTHRFA